MAVKGKLVILRHGQTDYNAAHLMTGQAESTLTALGEEQAREAGRLMADLRFDSVYSSTLKRAFNTAALALKASRRNNHINDNDIVQDIRIIEGDTGDFTGRNHKTDREIQKWRRQSTFTDRMPNGESDADLVKRVQDFFDNEILPKLQNGETVLVVCHAGIVRAFDYVLGVEDIPKPGQKRDFKPIMNAVPVIYEYTDGKLDGYHYPNYKPPKGPTFGI